MEIKQIRKANLELLMGDQERKVFAERTGMSYAHLNQVLEKHRNIGPTVARRIEKKLHLEHGWMDRLQKGPSATAEEPTGPYDLVSRAEAETAMVKFRGLHPAFRDYIMLKMDELDRYARALPEFLRKNLQAPSADTYNQWEKDMAADMIRMRIKNGEEISG